MRLLVLSIFGLILNYKLFACSSKNCCSVNVCVSGGCNNLNENSVGAKFKMVSLSNTDLLNLKNDITTTKNLRTSSAAISITYDDFEALTASGKSWLTFMDGDAVFQ